MAITKLQEKCPFCNKLAEVANECRIDGERLITYKCGHLVSKPIELSYREKLEGLSTNLGHKLYPFQVNAAEFCREANYCALLEMDTGTGKTVVYSALLAVSNLKRALIVCKSALRSHHLKTNINWNGQLCQVVSTGEDIPLPEYFPICIISFDMLWRIEVDDETWAKYDVIIIDETQKIKNPDAKRTRALRKVARHIPNKIGLSATPIVNHAGEYFTILNILRPDLFPYQQRFEYSFVDFYVSRGGYLKKGGLKNSERFYELTKDFIYRVRREDVLPDLPKINRTFQYCDLSREVESKYKEAVKDFINAYDKGEFSGSSGFTSLIAYLSRMRHITGISKTKVALEMVGDSLLSEPERKIVVFTHHKTVATLIHEVFSNELRYDSADMETVVENGAKVKRPKAGAIPLYPPSTLMDAAALSKEGQTLVDRFIAGDSPLAVVSTQAGGEGLNFQPVDKAIMLERQWSPVHEKQAEDRFPRPGATASVIDISYVIAVGTIDEWMMQLIEKKRVWIMSALDGKEGPVNWAEYSEGIVRELADIIAATGREAWSY